MKLYFLLLSLYIINSSARENGEGCNKDKQCDSGNCCGGVWPFQKCQECCKDKHCPDSKVCRQVSLECLHLPAKIR